MLRSILLVYEPTAASVTAAKLAQSWAERLEATIGVLGVLDETLLAPTPVALGGLEYKQARDEELFERDRQVIQAGLEAVAVRLRDAGVPQRKISRFGTPHQIVLDEAQSWDLLVLGNEARSDIGLGEPPEEILWEVLRAGLRPVVAVPNPFRAGSNVLVAYDGRPSAARALYAFQANRLARLGPVHVLSIDAASEEEAARRANRAVDFLAAHEVSASPHPVVSADKVATILGEAERVEAGLIVMGCLGRGPLREMLTGSTTSRLLRTSPYPLFLFR